MGLHRHHYGDIVSESPITRMFVQQFIQINNNKNNSTL